MVGVGGGRRSLNGQSFRQTAATWAEDGAWRRCDGMAEWGGGVNGCCGWGDGREHGRGSYGGGGSKRVGRKRLLMEMCRRGRRSGVSWQRGGWLSPDPSGYQYRCTPFCSSGSGWGPGEELGGRGLEDCDGSYRAQIARIRDHGSDGVAGRRADGPLPSGSTKGVGCWWSYSGPCLHP